MPNILLEYTNNVVIAEYEIKNLLLQVHKILELKLSTKIENCKSKFICYNDFVIGSGEDINVAFVCMHISVLKGRSHEVLDSTTKEIYQILKKFFFNTDELNVDVSVEIKEISDHFIK